MRELLLRASRAIPRVRVVRVRDQYDLAADLAADLDICGHDDVLPIDLLDSLAGSGLALVRCPGAASWAYLRECQKNGQMSRFDEFLAAMEDEA